MDFMNTWYLTRATGLISYLLLSVSVISGLYVSIRRNRSLQPGIWAFFHQPLANWGLYIALFHGLILLYDRYVTFHWYDILLPFVSSYQTVPVGLGIMALYFLFATIVTSELRSRIGLPLWRKLHILSPVGYVLATFHGIILGTDSQQWMAKGLYIGSVSLVALFLIFRVSTLRQPAILKKR